MRVVKGAMVWLAGTMVLSACTDDVPTRHDPDLIPTGAETFELRMPFDEFARDFRVLGGFGAPSDMDLGLVALDRPEGLEARTLLRFGPIPTTATVEVEDGQTQVDSSLTYRSGEVVLQMDTVNVQGDPPFEFSLFAVETRWDRASATWEMAVDTLGETLAWEEPGAGPARFLGEGVWEPEEGDSVVVAVDSAAVAQWADTTDLSRGLRISAGTSGARLRVESASLRVDAEPSLDPDTLITVTAGLREITFIHSPTAPPPGDEVQVGGAPSRRSIFRLEIPTQVDPPSASCARIPCPLTLTPEMVVFASLILESRTVTPPALQPADTTHLEVRPVLDPNRLPRSPLGAPAQSRAVRIGPSLFGSAVGRDVEVPVTLYIRDLLEAREEGREDFSTTLALLSAFEPTLPGIATFAPPGEAGGPRLRLLITLTDPVELP